jgi:hypothetical protein
MCAGRPLLCVIVVTLCGGCFIRSSLVSFPPPQEVREIEVLDATAPDDPPIVAIKDSRKIGEVLSFLQRTEGRWETETAPSEGKYSVAFVGENIRMFLRTGDGILQVQGADYKCHFRQLTPEEQDQLLALLDVPPDKTLSPGSDNLADKSATRPDTVLTSGVSSARPTAPRHAELEDRQSPTLSD